MAAVLHSGSTWLLLPVGWSRDDAVTRLPDDPSCRLDFRPPR